MKKKYITVREWIKNYEAGKYDDPSFNVQCSAGWNDWFCLCHNKRKGCVVYDIEARVY